MSDELKFQYTAKLPVTQEILDDLEGWKVIFARMIEIEIEALEEKEFQKKFLSEATGEVKGIL